MEATMSSSPSRRSKEALARAQSWALTLETKSHATKPASSVRKSSSSRRSSGSLKANKEALARAKAYSRKLEATKQGSGRSIANGTRRSTKSKKEKEALARAKTWYHQTVEESTCGKSGISRSSANGTRRSAKKSKEALARAKVWFHALETEKTAAERGTNRSTKKSKEAIALPNALSHTLETQKPASGHESVVSSITQSCANTTHHSTKKESLAQPNVWSHPLEANKPPSGHESVSSSITQSCAFNETQRSVKSKESKEALALAKAWYHQTLEERTFDGESVDESGTWYSTTRTVDEESLGEHAAPQVAGCEGGTRYSIDMEWSPTEELDDHSDQAFDSREQNLAAEHLGNSEAAKAHSQETIFHMGFAGCNNIPTARQWTPVSKRSAAIEIGDFSSSRVPHDHAVQMGETNIPEPIRPCGLASHHTIGRDDDVSSLPPNQAPREQSDLGTPRAQVAPNPVPSPQRSHERRSKQFVPLFGWDRRSTVDYITVGILALILWCLFERSVIAGSYGQMLTVVVWIAIASILHAVSALLQSVIQFLLGMSSSQAYEAVEKIESFLREHPDEAIPLAVLQKKFPCHSYRLVEQRVDPSVIRRWRNDDGVKLWQWQG